MRVYDAVLVEIEERGWDPSVPGPRPPLGSVPIGRAMHAETLSDHVIALILRACLPCGETAAQPPSLRRDVAYALTHEHLPDPSERRRMAYDSMRHLQAVVALSRIVRPNRIALGLAATVHIADDDSVLKIVPIFEQGPASVPGPAPPALEAEYGWLDEQELATLDQLVTEIERTGWKGVPPRVRMALTSHENACYSMDMRVRVVLMASAWESLTTIGRLRVSRQFAVRGAALAARAGVPDYGVADAEQAYDVRSSLVHGRSWPERSGTQTRSDSIAAPSVEESHAKMERALRRTLLHVLQTPSMWRSLMDDESLEQAFPAA